MYDVEGCGENENKRVNCLQWRLGRLVEVLTRLLSLIYVDTDDGDLIIQCSYPSTLSSLDTTGYTLGEQFYFT